MCLQCSVKIRKENVEVDHTQKGQACTHCSPFELDRLYAFLENKLCTRSLKILQMLSQQGNLNILRIPIWLKSVQVGIYYKQFGLHYLCSYPESTEGNQWMQHLADTFLWSKSRSS